MRKTIFILPLFMMVLFSCSNNDDKLSLNRDSIQMIYEDTNMLTANLGNENVDWYSDNDFVASVKNGIVTANHAGKTKIFCKKGNDVAECLVTVNPTVTLYEDPILEWGATPQYIKEKLGDKAEYLSLDQIQYKSSNVTTTIYMFENKELKSVGVRAVLSKYEELGNHLKQRYYCFNINSSTIGFMDAYSKQDATFLGGLQVSQNLFYVIAYTKI